MRDQGGEWKLVHPFAPDTEMPRQSVTKKLRAERDQLRAALAEREATIARLRGVLESNETFLETVLQWTGSDPEELNDQLDETREVLRLLDSGGESGG